MLAKRRFGRSREDLSIITFGGIVVRGASSKEADERVAWAVEQGVNFFDCAPSYGNAEEMLGPALKPHRDKVFLAEKTGRRDAAGAREQMERSLSRLHTDRFDLYQLHALYTLEQVEQCFGKDGAMETILAAREAGKVRYIGFSAHTEAAALECLKRFNFDSVMFPINFACWRGTNFGPAVVDAAREKQAATLALKPMVRGKWDRGADRRQWKHMWYEPLDRMGEVALALRWTLGQGVTTAIPPGEWPLFKMGVEIASKYRPLSEAETQRLMALAPEATPLFP